MVIHISTASSFQAITSAPSTDAGMFTQTSRCCSFYHTLSSHRRRRPPFRHRARGATPLSISPHQHTHSHIASRQTARAARGHTAAHRHASPLHRHCTAIAPPRIATHRHASPHIAAHRHCTSAPTHQHTTGTTLGHITTHDTSMHHQQPHQHTISMPTAPLVATLRPRPRQHPNRHPPATHPSPATRHPAEPHAQVHTTHVSGPRRALAAQSCMTCRASTHVSTSSHPAAITAQNQHAHHSSSTSVTRNSQTTRTNR